MKYANIAGLDLQVSRVVLGVDNAGVLEGRPNVLDAFFDAGGNAFDTAFIYSGGRAERELGDWVAHRGVRNQVVILDKGAHTPNCDPESLLMQHSESLQRLQTDYVDVYMMHRDNLDVPVSEFVDAMHACVMQGSMRVVGVSNWTVARIEEANAYARANGRVQISAVSNNFSLARMVEPPWAGCMAASDDDFRDWLTARQMPLLPWSSQARGFFLENTSPQFVEDPERVRCWFSDANFERLARARSLASQRGVQAINIALAYVLAQPFPTFPLIGPRNTAELRSSLAALDVELSSAEVRWLDLRQETQN